MAGFPDLSWPAVRIGTARIGQCGHARIEARRSVGSKKGWFRLCPQISGNVRGLGYHLATPDAVERSAASRLARSFEALSSEVVAEEWSHADSNNGPWRLRVGSKGAVAPSQAASPRPKTLRVVPVRLPPRRRRITRSTCGASRDWDDPPDPWEEEGHGPS